MNRKDGERLNIENVMTFVKMLTPDEQIVDHYRQLHYDVRVVNQMIQRCKAKLTIADRKLDRTRYPIDPRQDWGMRVWRKTD